jgi:hypothetical protein
MQCFLDSVVLRLNGVECDEGKRSRPASLKIIAEECRPTSAGILQMLK